MQPKVICYLPVNIGTGFNEYAWGMLQIAKKINVEKLPLACIVIHAGMDPLQIHSLPCDEVYHVKLPPGQWRIADHHIEAFDKTVEAMNVSRGIYLFSSDPLYHEVAVRSSVRHGAAVITNAIEIQRSVRPDSPITVKREIYRDKAHEFVTFRPSGSMRPQYITCNNMILYGKASTGFPETVREINLEHPTESKLAFLSESVLSWEQLKITEARCVIGIGRGVMGTPLDGILQLAELLNAPIGGSKVADELNLIPRDRRIGSSGNAIDADIYIAIGISGSSQHMEGIKGVKHVIAVNSDPSAPIFQRCEIGLVGRFQEVIPMLVECLKGSVSRS